MKTVHSLGVRQMTKQSEEDHFIIGFHGAPDDEQLRGMSYVELCSKLETAKAGTVRYMLLETEKRRRDSHPPDKPANVKPSHAADPSTKPANDIKHWSDQPVGKIGIGIAIGVLVLCAVFVLRHYLSLPI